MVDLRKACLMCPSILQDEKKLKAVLSDLYTDPDDKQRINLLTMLIDMGIVERIRLELEDPMLIPKMVAAVTRTLPLDSELTEWAVREWCNCLTKESNSIFYDPAIFEVSDKTLVKYLGNEKDVIVPIGIAKIKSQAFDSNLTISSITIPKSVTEIEANAFNYCENLAMVIVENENSTYYDKSGVLFNSKDKSLSFYPTGKRSSTYTIPRGIERIGNYAFQSNSYLHNIILPDTISEIGYGAFLECKKLKELVIPDGISIVEEYTFSNCNCLERVTLPNTVLEIGYEAFGNCSKLKKIDLPIRLEKIDASAFSNCTSLESIVFPQSVKEIESFAFSNCIGLKSVHIPEGTVNVDDDVFEDCKNALIYFYRVKGSSESELHRTGKYKIIYDPNEFEIDGTVLKKYIITPVKDAYSRVITIPNGITRIDAEAFANHPIKKIIAKNGLTSIGNAAFEMCLTLEEVILPDDVTEIGMGAFSDCRNLKEIIIPPKLKTIEDWCFSNCISMEMVNLPHGVKKIGNNAFSGCKTLSKIIIPESVVQIGTQAFEECKSLSSITIPKSVRRIGLDVFASCNNLREVHYAGTKQMWAFISDNLDLPPRAKVIIDAELKPPVEPEV